LGLEQKDLAAAEKSYGTSYMSQLLNSEEEIIAARRLAEQILMGKWRSSL